MQLDETLLAASLDLYHLLLHSHEGKEECPARDGCTTRKKLETVEFRDVRVVLQSPWRMIDQSHTTTNAANEWGVQRGNANDDAVGTARLEQIEETGRRCGAMYRTWSCASSSSSSSGATAVSGEVHAPRARRTTEDAGLPSLKDLAESRPVQAAHGEMMRPEELSGETSKVAEVSGEKFEAWTPETMRHRRICASDLLCGRVRRQSEKKRGFAHCKCHHGQANRRKRCALGQTRQ